VDQTPQKTECSYIPTVINKSIAKEYLLRNRVLQRAFKRLELLDAKVSRAVLRGRDDGNIILLPDTLATLSSGEQFENQKHYRRNLGRIKGLSKGLSRKKEGSKNWYKHALKLAKAQYRVVSQRSDTLHKMTTYIARTYALIGMEDLSTKGMLTNHHLAQAVSDASFYETQRQLCYKSESYGGYVQLVSRWYPSSKTCHHCGWIKADLTLADREWICGGCGKANNRDENAAHNIEAEALRLVTDVPGVASSTRKFAGGAGCAGSLATTSETFCEEAGTEMSSDVA
jgi:IS605 OrfB family transposase